jgi:hypothetical protein
VLRRQKDEELVATKGDEAIAVDRGECIDGCTEVSGVKYRSRSASVVFGGEGCFVAVCCWAMLYVDEVGVTTVSLRFSDFLIPRVRLVGLKKSRGSLAASTWNGSVVSFATLSIVVMPSRSKQASSLALNSSPINSPGSTSIGPEA